ncbi:hypothetical protein A2U94_03260 [Bacillus sp. VT 712]|uniref:YetF C-terminal domain-containing protein n=1 Tax=Priestia veravalensis TaxID=1414648 RepID=A0A0V8JJS8_9BACI|nr:MULTISPECIES: DUF421 domain-containing protein [Bacillaceae]KSU87330.1 hypothetical protein AS180_13880 [Priestia veravalensis]KZB92751.1 hypothetical protein A2U94_03260 [Bacillus sp. VT 712]SCC39489.1 Uncharacterized membrane protein YcaP, DUF421 family [Priestia flexa]
MEIVTMVFRTILLYFIVLVIFRLMGKREIGELSILDLVVFIMLAELAVVAIENTNDPLHHSLVPMITLLVIQIGLALWSLKSNRMRNFLDGQPTVIIQNGEIREKEMKKQHYNFNDLLIQLRDKNVKDIADVEFAILEPSGKLSVFEKKNNTAPFGKESLNLPYIIDGVVQEEHLALDHRTTLWLRQELKKLGYQEIKNISYCTYNNGTFFVDKVDEPK